MRRVVGGTSLALLLLLAPAVGRAASVDQTAAKQLFEIPHMDEVVRGNRIHYKFERKVSLPEYPAPGYTDKIHVDVTKVEPDGKRDVALQVFSGPRAKHVWEETGMTGNPLLGWYLDNSINQFRAVAGGDRDFLKNNFKIAIRDKAKHEEIKATWKGKEVDAMRVTIVPYAENRDKKKMQGYENSRFTLVFSPSVPGYFLELSSHYEPTSTRLPTIDETISLADVGEQSQ
jgi:hypothetical protein